MKAVMMIAERILYGVVVVIYSSMKDVQSEQMSGFNE